MKEKLNTNSTYTFPDGDTVEMTLSFYKLFQLRTKRPRLYERYSKIMAKKGNDDLELITILYTAYACANLDNLDELMTEEEFMIKCGSDRITANKMATQLLYPKK